MGARLCFLGGDFRQDRVQRVKAGQAQRQKTRADNLRERSQSKKKKGGRPGFEGSKPHFRA